MERPQRQPDQPQHRSALEVKTAAAEAFELDLTPHDDDDRVAPFRFLVDPLGPGRDFDRLLREVIGHLQGVVGAALEVSVVIKARSDDGLPETVVRPDYEKANTHRLPHGVEET